MIVRTVILLTIGAVVAACSTVNIRQLSQEASTLVNISESDLIGAQGKPDFIYVEPTAPEIRYLGYTLGTGCTATYLLDSARVSIAVTIGPKCHESPREPTRADWAVNEIKGTHIGEVLLTMFGIPNYNDLDDKGSGVLSYRLGTEWKRREPFRALSRTRQEYLQRTQEPIKAIESCTVDIAFSDGIALGGWTKGGGCKEREF